MNRPAPDSARAFAALREQAHPRCVVCDPRHPHGLRLACVPRPDGSVEATFDNAAAFEGYSGQLHGGIAAALLDGAMTNCLLARGIPAVTAELRVRYHRAVTVETPLTVRAWIRHSRAPLYLLEAELRQNGELKARAEGKFMLPPRAPHHPLDCL